jgi:hypothetical protein
VSTRGGNGDCEPTIVVEGVHPKNELTPYKINSGALERANAGENS